MLQISSATKNNWKRLNISDSEIESKLSKRANKTFSIKNILPKEYFKNSENFAFIKNFLLFLSEFDFSVKEIIYNLGINLLKREGLIKISNKKIFSDNKNILKILEEFDEKILYKELIDFPLLNDEEDILGIIYQSLMKEGNKNQKGSYYTPKNITRYLFDDIKDGCVFLDPCCGTGSFLLSISNKIKNPDNIYGIDSDEIACFISKINLVIKFKNHNFYPNIYNFDFLEPDIFKKINKKFDLICTNPPWGAKTVKNKKFDFNGITESFSMFIIQSKNILSENGACSFVLPESILNVKTHTKIRKFILDNFNINEIKNWGPVFSGVMTDVITIKLSKLKTGNDIKIITKNKTTKINKNIYIKNKSYNFNLISNKDDKIIKKIYSVPHSTLKGSLWGLGIVTGNNSKHIYNKKIKNSEIIFSGKEVSPYILNKSDKYIIFDRNNFQQTAPDYIYRAKEKLIYKFISKNLVFSYDNNKSLVLNSANILIPVVETHSIKTVLAFLNSKILKYIYKTKFGEIKILKGNLLQLPFPYLDNSNKNKIESLVDKYLKNKDNKILEKIDKIIFDLFKIKESEIT